MTDSFIHRRADFKLWAENTNGRYEDQRNGVSPRRSYDPINNEEDKKRLQEAILELVNEQLGRKYQKK
jgi:hypothetical protein